MMQGTQLVTKGGPADGESPAYASARTQSVKTVAGS